jgi:hypothetical protein
MDPQIEWPVKGAKVFVDGGEYYEFAHLGWGTIATEFHGYMDAYREAADAPLRNPLGTRDISVLDTHVYPILFLYRQHIELALKWLYLLSSKDGREVKSRFLKTASHDLMEVWEKVKPLLLKTTSQTDSERVEAADGYLRQLHEFDTSSFTFRYPITKTLARMTTQERRLNLRVVGERMEELNTFLDAAIDHLTSVQDEMPTLSDL